MKAIRTAAVIAAVSAALVLGGCAGNESDESAQADSAPPRDRALLDAARQPLDRAHAVEEITAGRKAKLDEEISESEQ